MTQDQLVIDGHAFEARLYAEDVPKGFLPATGRLAHLAFAPGARSDSGVRTGDAISPFYDPMIAKIITHGPTRDVALARMRAALAGTQVAGTVTNLGFLSALCAHQSFGAGDVDTGLIGRDLDALVAVPAAQPADVALAALAALGLLGVGDWQTGFALWSPLARQVMLEHAGEEVVAEVTCAGPDRRRVVLDGAVVEAMRMGGRWMLDGQVAAMVRVTGDLVTVFAGAGLGFRVIDPLARDAGATGDGNLIVAPMPGMVKAVFAKAGQAVQAGDRLAVLEAMKMEHALLAARDGIVAEVLVQAGTQVEAGAALVRLEEAEEGPVGPEEVGP